jgi:dTDP-4-amino-4,6-dideoxygalactose transaminase
LNHRQAPYRDDPAFRIDRAIWFHQRGLNLPCSADLTASDVDRVCEAIKSFLGA